MKYMIAVLVAACAASGAAAQNPPPRQSPDSAPAGRMMPMHRAPGQGPDAAQLRQQVEERFGRMIQTELQLNDQQLQRVRDAMRANEDRRLGFARREMDVRRAIMQQLQPGVAANQDSLNRLLTAQANLRTQRAQSDEQFVRELGFLTAVQRARLVMMIGRMEERMGEVRRRLAGQPGMPGMAPGMGPGDRQPRRAAPGARQPLRRQ
jgi:Spy/CpxP family protein refolding chaperone